MADMEPTDLLADAFGRIPALVEGVLKGLGAAELNRRPGGEGNSIAWLVWHLSRVQDDHLSDVAGTDQQWISAGFKDRFGFGLQPEDTGYGHSHDQVSAVQVESGSLLQEYYQAVQAKTLEFLNGLDKAALDRIVDDSWDPSVSLGVRLVSVLQDCLMHVGQAAYVRGLPPGR
ncbi:mycothiol transferase [Arthrobacter sp. A5]|uniref:mycothiol transferase n=1 Tax=Arthrobacter sp. A5 TaxID=576926 RepID=UPI003DA8A12C